MGLIERLADLVFGGGRNVVAETVEVFRENAESAAARSAASRERALGQFAQEFAHEREGGFDRFMDGLNRLPRPLLAFGTLGLFVSAMIDPVWFAARMQGIALVPEPLWWLLGAIVSFYFGARHQAKGQAFQRDIARTIAHVPQVAANIDALAALRAGHRHLAETGDDAALTLDAVAPAPNAALADWRSRGGAEIR